MNIQTVLVTQIKPSPYNPRKDLKPTDPEYQKIKRSIEEFGMVEPIVWNKRSGNLVGGHQRFKYLTTEKGSTSLDVSVVDLDPKKEKALNIALNKIDGQWDYEQLQAVLHDLDDEELGVTGFDPGELSNLMNGDFNPPPVDPNSTGGSHSPVFRATLEQAQVILQAVTKVKAASGEDDITEGRCLELICADYLAGQ